ICKEAIIWQGLKHELVLPFFGVDKEIFAPAISLVSPWMNEGTVLAYLGRHGREDVPRFTREVAEALAYLHASKVVHGDLRGANILISNVSPHHALLADFGLASVIRDEDADLVGGALTSSSHAGNIRWWAPELCSPAQFGFPKFVRTPEVDAWAFGWVCCELVTGEIPFAEMNEVQAMREVIAGHRPERPEGMGIDVWEIVCAVWAEKADARPCMAEIASWLREVQACN
ncbi:kinase-like domain-containing protein, partial [Mycena sp. CBHHK59/15]